MRSRRLVVIQHTLQNLWFSILQVADLSKYQLYYHLKYSRKSHKCKECDKSETQKIIIFGKIGKT